MARSSTTWSKGESGNPSGRATNRFRKLLRGQVTDSAFVRVVDAIIEAAVTGDMQAAKLLLSYVLGPPAPEADSDGTAPPAMDVTRLIDHLTDAEVGSLLERLELEGIHE